MTPFFQDPKRILKLREEAQRWVGTPFAPHQAVPQGGVDCVHLVATIAAACGFPHEFKPPAYKLDATFHTDRSDLLDYLDTIPGVARLPKGEQLMPGDLPTFRLGRAPHHLGIVIAPPRFLHCMRGLGTGFAQLDDPTYARRLGPVYRCYEP